jgi:hypothetical protein
MATDDQRPISPLSSAGANPQGAAVPARNGNRAAPTSSDKHLADPPQRPSRSVTWLLLLLTLSIASIPMLINLSGPQVAVQPSAEASLPSRLFGPSNEAVALLTAMNSYKRHELGNGAGLLRIRQLVPYDDSAPDSVPNLRRAPGTYWAHRLAMACMAKPTGDVDLLVAATRRASVAMALLTIAATFWAGFSVGGRRAAALAALVLASNPIFIYYARQATPAIYHAGWAMLSIAAALWALRPLKPGASPERQLIGWMICGLALGAATLTAGSVTALTVFLPILLLLLLCENRVGHLMGLLAALFMCLLAVLPWMLYAHDQNPEIWKLWLADLWLVNDSAQDGPWLEAGWRALVLAVALLPWTLWYIAGAAQPFSTSSKGQRIRLLLGGFWFVVVALGLLGLPAGNRLGVLLPSLGPGAVLLGQLFNRFTERASTGRHVRLWCWLRWPHLLLLMAASALLPMLLLSGDWLSVPDETRTWPADQPQWVQPALAITILLVIVLIAARWAWKHYPTKAMVTWSIWSITLMAMAIMPLTLDLQAHNPLRQNAQTIGNQTGQTLTYWYNLGAADPAIKLYAKRSLLTVDSAQVKQALELNEPFFLVGPTAIPEFAEQMTEVASLDQIEATLWQFKPLDQ